MQQVNAQSCMCNQTYPDGCLINQNCTLVISHSNSTWNAVDELLIENCNVTICLEKLVGKAILNFSQLTINNANIIQDDACYSILSQQLIFLGNQTIISSSNILLYGNIQFQFITTNMSISHANLLSNSLNLCTDYLQVSNSTIRTLMQNKSQCSCLSNQNCSNQMYIKTIFSFVGYITQNYTNLSSQYIEQQWISQFQCSFFSPKTLTYFTSLISVKNHFSLAQHSKIKGFYVGIYAYSLEIDRTSQILTDGMGYSTNEGYGCGYTDKIIGLRQQCGGTGGSHGGMGGFSISPKSNYNQLCLQLQSKQIYDYSFNPVLPGSGGGGVTYGNQFYKFESQGQGGGVMHLEVLNLYNDGIISSNGSAYIQEPFFGSGSGGSIQIRIIYFSGQGLVTADGGGSQSGNDFDTDQFARQKFYQTYQIYGGFGGGGRIRLFFFNITEMINSSYYNNCNSIMQTNPGGLSIQQKDILNMSNQGLIKFQGSITPTGCPQGTQGIYCQKCGKGYYKMLFGQAPCKPCFNTINKNTSYQIEGENTPFCKVVCNDGKQPKEDQCLTGLAEFSQKLGGQNVIFALFVTIILLLINIAIVWASRDKNSKKSRQFYGSYDESSFQQMTNSLSELNNKTYLISQDLHFHVRRIYLAGCNTYQNPWQIYQETLVDSDLNQGDNKELQVLFETFNQKALFTVFEKYTLIFFKFYYYPLYIWILQLIQKNKFKTLSKLFVKQEHLYNGLDSDRDKMKLKFSCSKDKTLAFIDRLNLALKIVEQSNTLELPIYLVLSGYGTFSYPFQINIHDALIKRLWQQFSFNTNEESINLFEKFVTEFNYYAVKIDFRQSQSSFIQRFLELVNYTNQYNYEIFRLHHFIQVDICIHIIAIQPCSQSQVYLLGNANQRELEFLLKQIHVMKNLPEEFTIKLSIIFNNYNKERIINLESFNNLAYNINEQLQIIVNKDKDDLKNQIQQEKKKMQSKINCFKMDGMKQYKLKGIQVVKRFFTWLFSQITRYRDSRVNQQFLIAGICITLAIQWCFVIAYPVLLFIVNDLESDQIFVAEFITQLVIFPVAQIISLVILSAWLLKSRRNYGKMYLLFNLCALASSLIEFIFGCYDLFNFNSSAEFNLFKLFPFFFIMLSSHLVCLQMNFNELNKTKYFEI
ncbi:unnamed protein product (macronuclear) [Paramecium tetraurelia]|uniref:Tyrosine-protein kinase ephrin type A/B receptor-like domain-containing protein n=1 Tax=Paramecium tetraurelia TaxID=5888 RepID=A0BVR0_PARTE|nr:uncharacterized protein GSPATT00032479001 [Paramecium tetraurelia]CAK62627.1 unnamed protein product [Paramecium tetraurelia]|eukprot:XP_001430025.1 hypothetical protein (macronuclear) [Paramecium tetraurelia strain d4-2]